jgi:hypothetical protein
VKFVGETRDAVASLYPPTEEARITCAIVHAAGLKNSASGSIIPGRIQPGN